MLVEFNQLPAHTRFWIFTSNRLLTQEELELIIKTKSIFLGVVGETMPPVFLEIKNLFYNESELN